MNPQVCANCCNKNPVNLTDNRLVTESCGHAKCMSCLVQETSGCGACLRKPPAAGGSAEDAAPAAEPEPAPARQDAAPPPALPDHSANTKLETSHITIETDADGKKMYVCLLCKKRFRARSQVTYHAYCNGQSKPYQCALCADNKRFASLSHYKHHMRVHRNERSFACDACPRAFFQLSKLRRHQLQHTQSRAHACPDCGKAFAYSWSLRAHRRTHTGERPHACAHCARRFRDSSNLAKHVRAQHAPARACAACGRASCAGRCAARLHACARCPRSFRSPKDLRRHAAVHDDAKPFCCGVCARRFRRKDNLERHARNTHGAAAARDLVLSANTARRSVIVAGPPAPPREYVHKIRRAACGVALPPIDAAKLAELARHTELAPARPPRDDAIFKKILCDEPRSPPPAAAPPAAHQLHWRKLKLNNPW